MYDIERLLDNLNINQIELCNIIGITSPAMSKVKSGKMDMPKSWKRKIKEKFNVDVEDYIFAKGEYKKDLPVLNHDPNGKEIPFYDTEVFATISPVLSDVVALKPSTFIHIPMFSQGEFALQVTGNSMKGLINSNDWIVVKKIINREAIIYGEVYLVVTREDNLKTVKFIKEHQNKKLLWLVPYNIEQFSEQAILKSDILEMYKVVGLFRSI